MLEDRQLMALLVRQKDGGFTRIQKIYVNQVGSLYDLRKDISTALRGEIVRGKAFVMLDQSLVDIPGSHEKKLVVSEVFNTDCVFIRWLPVAGKNCTHFY